jgi:CheY-like chemotaxis protein
VINKSDILKANLLIVDDQAANVLLLERILRSAGYTSIASTQIPQEVYQLHKNNNYDLILLDLHMPVMDGFKASKEIRRYLTEVCGNVRQPLIAALTAYTTENFEELS